MILKIAWKNIWRNPTRSLVVIIAVALGLWAGVFASAFVNGMMKKKIENVIKLEMSDFQIHQPKFRDELSPKLYIENASEILNNLNNEPGVVISSGRVISNAMIATTKKSGAAKVMGIVPEIESTLTGLDQHLKEGSFFENAKRNPILVSQKTAEDYNLKLRSKMILTLQDIEGEITSVSFRVIGIYKTENNMFDKGHVFVRQKDLRRAMAMPQDAVHEIAVALNDHDLAESLSEKYQTKHPKLEVKPWMDLASGMRFMVQAMDAYLFYIVGIILLALLFSILNTMLMAVLERVREIGMLMAVGMSKLQIFSMIMLETIMLAMIGGPLGLLLSYAFVNHFGQVGINLAGAAYEDAGFSPMVHPFLDNESYIQVAIMVFVMAVLAAIYPARKALKLRPVEAIRKI